MDDPFFQQSEKKFYEKVASPKVVRILKQTGKKPDIPVDKARKALKAGKRISKTGHVYWETRKNRSDVVPTKHL